MDFEKARFNMIEQQIRPWNVLDQRVLDILGLVKREHFVCESLQQQAFTDCELPIRIDNKNSGEFMLSPKIEARMQQELALSPSDKVLEIGTGTGYTAALLARQAGQVVTVEIDPNIAALARSNLTKNNIDHVKVIDGCGFSQADSLGLFDAIVLSGNSPVLPKKLLELLKPNGRFIGIIGETPVMQMVFAQKTPQGQISSKALFETQAKTLTNAPKAKAFEF
jgi:protein-L-isoaspartate(D-aspartate) O-methyltransferase